MEEFRKPITKKEVCALLDMGIIENKRFSKIPSVLTPFTSNAVSDNVVWMLCKNVGKGRLGANPLPLFFLKKKMQFTRSIQ